MSGPERLARQIAFILEVDRAKQVLRRNPLLDGSRPENDAEHSWHLAVMALVLAEYAEGPSLDLLRVLKMLLIHDLVEIDAGDTFVYDPVALSGKEQRERAAADRLFHLLPPDQAADFRASWDEFEEGASPEARFAAALDRLQPLLLNYHSEGGAWRAHGIHHGQVIARNEAIGSSAPALWECARALIDDALVRGYVERAPEE